MAAKSAIGIRRLTAVEKLTQAMGDLFGEGFILPTQGKDPDLLHAVQLEAIADFLAAQVRHDAPEYEIGVDYGQEPDKTVSSTVDVKAQESPEPQPEESEPLNALMAMRGMKPAENKGTRKRKAS